MRKLVLPAVIASLIAASAAAQAPDLSAFDASHTNSAAEKLVLCDTTAFLRTRPDLDADRIYTRREGRPFQLLLGPYFVQGGFLYSERYERLQQKLQAAGMISSRQIAEIQATRGRAFIEAMGRLSQLPNTFAAGQARYCDAFARENGVTMPE